MVRKTAAGKLVEPSAQALKNSELHYRRLFEAAQDGILILDAQTGMIDDVNPSLIKMLGYSREEFVQKKLWEVGVFRDIQASKDAFKDLQANEYTRYEDLPLKTKDGRVIQVEFVSNVYLVGDEKVIQCDIRDITEHRRIITALEANEKMYHGLINQSPDGYFIIELSGKILTVNKAICKELEFSDEELLSMHIWDIIPEQFLDQYRERLTKILKGESLKEAAEYEVRGKNGKTHYVEVISAPRYSGRDIIGFQGIARDITARKQAEEALRESERRFREILETVELVAVTLDTEGRITFCNDYLLRLTGHNRADVLGQDWFAMFVPPDLQVAAIFLAGVRQGTVPAHFENEILTVSGERRLVSWSNTVLRGAEGRIIGTTSIGEDITARKRAQEALRESDERFRALIENASDMIVAITVEGNLSYVSPAVQRISGYQVDEALGRNIVEFIHADDMPLALESLASRSQISGLAPAPIELRFRHKDGTWRIVEVLGNNLVDHAAIAAIVLNVRDITERKQAEDALRESEKEFQSLAESMPQMVWITRPDGWNIYFNQQWVDYTGLTLEESSGHGWNKPFHPDDQQRAWDAWQNAVNNFATYSLECRLRRADGVYKWWLVRGVPVLDEQGTILKWFGTCTDIDELKQAEEALRESEEQLVTAQAVAKIGSWETDLSNLKVIWSEETYRILEIDPKSYKPSHSGFLAFIHPEDRARVDAAFLGSFDTRTPNAIEHRIVTPGGIEKFIEERWQIIRDVQGQPLRALGTCQDITERKQGEAALRESESKFRTLVAHLPIVVYMNPVGDATSTLYISPQIEKLAGYSPEEWLADPKLWLKSLHSDDRQHVLEQTAKFIQSGAPFELDYRLTARDGSLVWVHDQLVIVNDAEGRPQYWQGIMIDITERKQAEEMIRRQVDYLTALQDIDRTIASDVNMQLSLNALIVKARSLLAVDAAAVLLIDYSMNAFEFAAADGFRTNIAEGSTIRMERTYAGRVAVKHRMVKIPNLKEEAEQLFLTSRLKGEDFVSYHGLPLIIKGKVIGVLEVFQRSLIKRDQEWLDFLNALAGQAAVAISNAQLFENLQQSNSELVQAYDATIEGWSRALDLRDKETEGHSQRVTEMTVRLARTFGLSEAELEQVRWGSLLHDIGKMGVPDGILLKPGALTDEEWIVMRKHPTFAFEMLSPIHFLRLALDIPYCHHEKWDGTGYPRGLKGDQIPLTARIFAIVDVWDALTSERSYRAAWSEEEAEIYIQNSSGTYFDPKAVDIFMQDSSRRSMTP